MHSAHPPRPDHGDAYRLRPRHRVSLTPLCLPFHYLDSPSAWWYVFALMRFGVVLEAFLERTLDDALDLLAATAPAVTDLEVGVGGFAPSPHCDVERLLRDERARNAWLDAVEGRGYRVSALNVSGNPLDPDRALGRRHDADLRNAIRLASLLGVDRIVAMAGCPPPSPASALPTSTPAGGCRTSRASTRSNGTKKCSLTGQSSPPRRNASIRRS